MKGKNIQKRLLLIIGMIILMTVGCPNNLIETIDKEVKVVVTPPSVSSIYPTADTVGFSVDDEISIVFTKQIESSSVNGSSFVVKDSEGVAVSGRYTVSNDTITFIPNNLLYSTVYTVTLRSGILDVDGNSLADEFSWDFTTQDPPAGIRPIVQVFEINNGRSATNSADVEIGIFATDYNGSSSGLDYRYRLQGEDTWSTWEALVDGSGSTAVTLDVTAGVTESFVYEAEVRDANNIRSNIFSAQITYETTPPSIIDVNWDDESVFPYNGSILKITFDEEMSPGSFTESDFTLKKVVDNSDIEGMINLNASDSFSNAVAELWGLELEPNTEYKATLQPNITDVAGNEMGGNVNTWYFTTGDATDTDPPDGPISLSSAGTIVPLPTGATATDTATLTLDLSEISDDYNSVWGMKFWGDSNDPALAFEDDVSWETFTNSKSWTVSNGSGTKFILYKFVDSAGNETETPGQIKIILDNDIPNIPTIEIDKGAHYSNSSEAKVDLLLGSSDDHSGVKEMFISNYSNFSVGAWQDWSPEVTDWELIDSEGQKFVYVKVRDYLDNDSSSNSDEIFLDRIAPAVTLSTDHVEVNSEIQLLEGSTVDDYYEITESNGIASYAWEQIGGSGTVYFNSEASAGNANDGVDLPEPFVWAESEGDNFIELTLTDLAGNSTSTPIPFTWDITAPANIANLSAQDISNGFIADAQPTWTWDTVSDTDFYRVSFSADFSSYEDIDSASYSPESPLAQGSNTLYVKAGDNAGNFSEASSFEVSIDSIAPEIDISTDNYVLNVANPSIEIDFSGGTGSDGSITDAGSGVNNIQWQKSSGDGSITFGSSNENTTTVTADTDGNYQISLTVSDLAGNESLVELPLLRDMVIPNEPTVNGLELTPSLRPTWFWSSNGGGVGEFQWNLDTDGTPEWSAVTDSTNYQPDYDLQGVTATDHTLTVRERDAAGNWSNPGSWTIQVDESAKTPPAISIVDGISALRNQTYITWGAVSGLGGSGTQYRYRIDGGTWTIVASALSTDPTSPTEIPQFTDLSDGNHTLEIQEYIDESTGWQEEDTGSHTITVDTTPPSIPNVDGSGYDTVDTNRTATQDTTPSWSWSSGGGGGNGQFEIQLPTDGNPTEQTTSTNYTAPISVDDDYILSVRERDQAGNWSGWASHTITVDTIKPVVTSVTLEGTSRSDDTVHKYTRTADIEVHISADISLEGGRTVYIQYWDYNPSEWKDWTDFTFTGTNQTITTDLPNGDGNKNVYVRLMDEAHNYSDNKYDGIILDTTPPSGSFTINAGDTYTPSLAYKMNLSFTDYYTSQADLEVSSYDNYGAGVWSSYRSYASIIDSTYQFSPTQGTKTAFLKVQDGAGNTVGTDFSIQDSIYLQVPYPTHAWKGYYTSGTTRVYYNPVTEDDGPNTTYYYTYSSTIPNLNPNEDASGLTYRGYTTSTEYDYVSINPEELTYFWIRAYNADTGGWGPYSANPVMGFSSNITIIYDSTDSDDIATAQYIKNMLKSDPTTYSSVSGTMPSWTVTLLPEAEVSTSYYSDGRNIIYGDPVILTPSTDDLDYYLGKTRNIVAGGHGVIAMSLNGLRFLGKVSDYWTSWGYPATASTDAEQQPNEIGLGNTYTITYDKSYNMYTWRYSNSVWTSPLSSTSIPTSSSEDRVQAGYDDLLTERALIRTGRTNPTRGYLYGRSEDYDDRFPVVRQGRFLYYGYDGMWTRPYSGWVYFINLVARMDNY